MPTCVLLSRRFIEMLSRGSLVFPSCAEETHVLHGERRERGKTLDLVLPPNSIQLRFLLISPPPPLNADCVIYVCFAVVLCKKVIKLREMYSHRLFPIQTLVRDYFVHVKKKKKEETRKSLESLQIRFVVAFGFTCFLRIATAFYP